MSSTTMTSNSSHRLIGTSPAIRALRQEVACAARSDAKVLLTGESGVGKEVTARLIHEQSQRRSEPFVAINCAGVPETLLESELFGHTRGSFTGAYRDRSGLLEAAHRGTILLDEIGETSLRMQGLLLRFLDTGEIQRIGGPLAASGVDSRVITATNRNLADAIEAKTFREDLFYRLNVIHIAIPPLRERREDVPELFFFFLGAYAERYGVALPELSREALAHLAAYDWPGNVRELRNVAERLAVRGHTRTIAPEDLPLEATPRGASEPAQGASTRATSDVLYERMVTGRECFWSVVYDPFMLRDLTRHELRQIVRKGLEQTRGSYSLLMQIFNMPPDDHARFVQFLRKHQCVPSPPASWSSTSYEPAVERFAMASGQSATAGRRGRRPSVKPPGDVA
jgi:transcriptional regulator with PAS, ATPase and Fis domain